MATVIVCQSLYSTVHYFLLLGLIVKYLSFAVTVFGLRKPTVTKPATVLQMRQSNFVYEMFVYDDCCSTDESDEIHERRVNPGSGVGELLRQDLK